MSTAQVGATRWWERATRQGRPVPEWVQVNLRYYETESRRARISFYVLETTVIVVSAAIPAAAAVGASVAVTGVLGAAVAAMVGLRQLSGWRESWVRRAVFRSAIEREVVSWSAGLGVMGDQTPTSAYCSRHRSSSRARPDVGRRCGSRTNPVRPRQVRRRKPEPHLSAIGTYERSDQGQSTPGGSGANESLIPVTER